VTLLTIFHLFTLHFIFQQIKAPAAPEATGEFTNPKSPIPNLKPHSRIHNIVINVTHDVIERD
jgi:hypothetical protein